ncbi:arylsulfatase [Alteromonas sp. ZYF713]|nr:arylsulfatase [Alteromonas sp. ZYF713]
MFMKDLLVYLFSPCLLLLGLSACVASEKETTDPTKPNIIVIVADDLGMADLGVFGGEIQTPNLDALANQSITLRSFHTAATCSPTRSMLMTGTDNHIAGMGSMREFMARSAPHLMKKPGYEGVLNQRVATLPEILTSEGYQAFMAGKWHLGDDEGELPVDRGFTHAFALMEGGASHMSDWGVKLPKGEATYYNDNKVASLPKDFYSTVFYTDTMIDYLDKRDKSRPFMAYLAYTAPHWPLQAPAASIAKFKGQYDDGYEALFKARFQRQKELGLIAKDTPLPPLPAYIPAWDSLSAAQQAESSRMMEVYAAMVADLDAQIGRFIDELKQRGEYDNSLIVFMSDNGAEDGDFNKFRVFLPIVKRCCDNSLENIGNANSFVMYGAGWARAGSASSAYAKGTNAEGGIRTPAFIRFPGDAHRGEMYQGVVSVMDILPTALHVAGIQHPAPTFNGRTVAMPLGMSLVSILNQPDLPLTPVPRSLGWELFSGKAYIDGDWKITLVTPPRGDNQWHLYNLSKDPGESLDLKAQYPEKFEELKQKWQKYSQETGVQDIKVGDTMNDH